MHPMPLLERERQVDAVLGYATEADAGSGRLVLVEGEAGGGKSTLLEEVEARLPDATWHWGACDGLFTPLPLSPLRDIAEQVGGDLLAALRADASRDAIFDALIAAVRNAPGLTVLVIEDVHWADEATLDLLQHTGRRIQKERVLLLVTFRGEESGPASPLRQTLGELARQRGTRRVILPPLTPAAVGQLVAGTPLDAAEVHALTGGNPYFVAEVVSAGEATLPASARDAVLARVSTLPPSSRAVLEAAALAGNRVDPEPVATVVDVGSGDYERLIQAGLLVTDDRALRFRHEIARLAVADAVPEPRRSDLHRGILAALLARGSDDESRLAFHARGAGDDAAVLLHAVAAAERAARSGAHHEAVEHHRHALAAGEALGVDAATRAAELDALSTELELVDQWAEAERMRGEAVLVWRALGDVLREGDDLRMRARALSRLARAIDARAALDEALAVLEPGGATPELARAVEFHAAALVFVEGDYAEAIAVSDRAAVLAEQLALPDVLSDALDTRACSLMALEQCWVPTMQRALEVGLAAGCDEQVGRAYMNYYGGLVGEGRFDEGERVFRDGMAFCAEREVLSAANFLMLTRVESLEVSGRWEEASRTGWSHLETAMVSPVRRMGVVLSLSRIGLRRGDAGTDPVLDEAVEVAEATGEPQWLVPFRLLVAERHWMRGEADEAVAAVAAACRAAALASLDGRLAGTSGVWARRLGLPHPDPADVSARWAPELRGEVAAAVQEWDAVGMPYEAAMALAFSAAVDDRVESLRRLEALGAAAVAGVVRRRLREDGVRSLPGAVRPATREHPAGLTIREQEVLEQLSLGLTNEEIAQRLVISTKTAGHHVSAVLAKLGVPGRREAATEARRRGLVPPA